MQLFWRNKDLIPIHKDPFSSLSITCPICHHKDFEAWPGSDTEHKYKCVFCKTIITFGVDACLTRAI